MVCPLCNTQAGIKYNKIVKETKDKEYHKVSFYCRYPECKNYKQEFTEKEYVDDKP